MNNEVSTGTSMYGLFFGGDKPLFVGYTDVNMAWDVGKRWSTSRFVVVTVANGALSWQSRLQKCVLFTTEAEFIASTKASKEMLWLNRLLNEIGFKQDRYLIHCDSESVIHLKKNLSFHSRTKHINVRYHWVRDMLEVKSFGLSRFI